VLTQHPRKIVGLDGYGVEIVEQIEIPRTPPPPGSAATA
jgi:GTP cyclohydrolase II